jgi:hypothetical protein
MKGSALKKTVPRAKNGGQQLPGKTSNHRSKKLYSSPPKMRFQDPIGHNLPQSLQNFRWNVQKVERKLQENIQ